MSPTLDERLARTEGVILDVDGCLLLSDTPGGHGGEALPGAAETIDALRRSGRGVIVFTNASNQIPADIARGLQAVGLKLQERDVLTPCVVAAEHILKRFGTSPVLAFGETGLLQVLSEAGVVLADEARPQDAAVVIVGWHRSFNKEHLQSAAEAIWNGAPLLVTSDARSFAGAGRPMVGVGGFIAQGLSYVTGCTYEVVGKPSPLAMRVAAARLGVRPDRVLVVGDDLTLESAMGKRAGGVGVLVTTGTHGRADVAGLEPLDVPDLIVDNLLELVDRFAAADLADASGQTSSHELTSGERSS